MALCICNSSVTVFGVAVKVGFTGTCIVQQPLCSGQYLKKHASYFWSRSRECVAVAGMYVTMTGDGRRGCGQTFGYRG